MLTLAVVAQTRGIKNVCEVDYIAGKSSGVFLLSNPQVKLINFNLNSNEARANYLKSLFANRISFLEINSSLQVESFGTENSHFKCDILMLGDDYNATYHDFILQRLIKVGASHPLIMTNIDISIWQSLHNFKPIYCDLTDRKRFCLLAVRREVQSDSAKRQCFYSLQENNTAFVEAFSDSTVARNDSHSVWIDCKYMIYTVLGAERWFNMAATMMIESLFASVRHNPPLCLVDVYIMTDKENFEALAPLVRRFNVHLHEVPRYKSQQKSSMEKLKVFSIPHIYSYLSVLFVDADVLFNIQNLGRLMAKVFSNPFKLHVYRERGYSAEAFNSEVFGPKKYWLTAREIDTYKDKGISPFNAGTFLFQPNQVMKKHFEALLKLIASYPRNETYFYEQSFMNYYFPKHDAMVYTLTEEELIMLLGTKDYPDDKEYFTLLHFTGTTGSRSKIDRMEHYLRSFMPWVRGNPPDLNQHGAKESGVCSLNWVQRGDEEEQDGDCEVMSYIFQREMKS